MVQEQLQTAYKIKNTKALNLMNEWEDQIIEARVLKLSEEALAELKKNEKRNINSLAGSNTLFQLHSMLKRMTLLKNKASEYRYQNQVVIYSEHERQIEVAIKLYETHEEKFVILRKMIRDKKLSSFEKRVVKWNEEWFSERLLQHHGGK